MTVTIDGKTLNVRNFDEDTEPAGTQWDAWTSEQYKKNVKVYGTVRKWTLECYEQGVAWNDSAAKHLQTVAKAGSTVTFVVDEGTLHQVNASVYVLGVDLRYQPGKKTHREFTLSLQEA